MKQGKAMIITMGTGPGVEHGMAFSIRQHNPNLLCLIYSSGSKSKLAGLLENLGISENEVICKQFDEVNDVERLHQVYSQYIDEIMSKGYPAQNIVVDYTSGTKSMSAALVSSSIVKRIGTLSYISGSRDKDGRVISGTERAQTLAPLAIFSENTIALFKNMFNRYQFAFGYELLTKSTIHPDYRADCEFYKGIAKAYGAWDRFNFKEAFSELEQVDVDIARRMRLSKTIKIHKQYLYKLNKAVEESRISESDLIDLYSNALRRFEEGKYDDSVSRLYRLVEMIAQIEFESNLGIKTGKVPLEVLPESIKKKYKENSENGYVKLGLLDSFIVLDEKTDNEKTKRFIGKIDDFKRLLKIRNDSRLAHGQIPISKVKCESLINFLREVFELDGSTVFPKLGI